MRVEKVNENTLRVSMTRDDLNQRGLKILDLLGNRDRVQEFFLSILHEVDVDNSFASDAPVTFQVMPNDRGIDLLITKMNKNMDMPEEMRRFFDPAANGVGGDVEEEEDEPRAFADLDPADDANTDIDPVIMHDLGHGDTSDYDDYWDFQESHSVAFDDIDDLLALADSLWVSDLASSVYYYQGKFYLKLAFMDENYAEMKPADAWAIANEFGSQVTGDDMDKAQRHGRCLFQQDALGALRRQLANK